MLITYAVIIDERFDLTDISVHLIGVAVSERSITLKWQQTLTSAIALPFPCERNDAVFADVATICQLDALATTLAISICVFFIHYVDS